MTYTAAIRPSGEDLQDVSFQSRIIFNGHLNVVSLKDSNTRHIKYKNIEVSSFESNENTQIKSVGHIA